MKWHRPVCRSAVKLCRVYDRDRFSARTLCAGSWPVPCAEESVDEPPNEEKCKRCVDVEERGEHVKAEVQRARERAVVELERFEAELAAAGNNGLER
jgi:hypothetical protein